MLEQVRPAAPAPPARHPVGRIPMKGRLRQRNHSEPRPASVTRSPFRLLDPFLIRLPGLLPIQTLGLLLIRLLGLPLILLPDLLLIRPLGPFLIQFLGLLLIQRLGPFLIRLLGLRRR